MLFLLSSGFVVFVCFFLAAHGVHENRFSNCFSRLYENGKRALLWGIFSLIPVGRRKSHDDFRLLVVSTWRTLLTKKKKATPEQVMLQYMRGLI